MQAEGHRIPPRGRNHSPVFLAAALLFFALGLNGTDIGLPEFLTAKRLGLALLTAGLLTVPFRRWKVPWSIRGTAWILAGIGIWGMLGTLIKGTNVTRDLNLVLAWFLTAYGLLAGTVLFSQVIPRQINKFVALMTALGGLAALGCIAIIVRLKGPGIFAETFALRIFLEEDVSTGLNRLMNGLFFLAVIPLAIVLQIIKAHLWSYIVSLATVSAFTFLALVSGSRQSVAALGLLLLALIFLRLALEKRFGQEAALSKNRRWVTVLLTLLGIAVVIQNFVTSDEYSYSINRRLVEKTTEQGSEGQVRLEVATAAWNLAWRNPVFGIGPGEFAEHPDNFTGEFPHNGYTGTMVEYGFLPLLVLILLILKNLKVALSGARIAFGAGRGGFFTTGLAFCLVFAGWMMVFNDLTREYFFWILMSGTIFCGLPQDTAIATKVTS